MAASIWNHLKQMGIRPQTRVRARRANRQPIFTSISSSILGVQDKQRPQMTNGVMSFGAAVVPWVVKAVVSTPQVSGGCWVFCLVLPLLVQPCIADWGPAPASCPPLPARPLCGGPSSASHQTGNSRLPARHSSVLSSPLQFHD